MGRPDHKQMLQNRTKSWGKKKFKPAPFVRNRAPAPLPDPEETAQPWQHVKSDIIDDAAEAGYANRLDADSEKAKEFRRQREQNHRRSIIEATRNETTTWESFEDEPTPAIGPKGELPTNTENFTFKERDFYRRKLTLGVSMARRKASLKTAIEDLTRNGVKAPAHPAPVQQKARVKKVKPKKELTDAMRNNPFQKQSIEY
ncbi:uncharacterized protein LOC117902564 [Drosophila subobscura]|uniref:uncharacterized protein LOC117902564 n=1 Tax=Drosophila subobscura TaxID=7241 RepID=UPI00155A6BA5|nr:uncharacterized protein LOC117902564 [Drosophila subobscura]